MLDAENKDKLAQRKGNTLTEYTRRAVDEGQVKPMNVNEDNQENTRTGSENDDRRGQDVAGSGVLDVL